MEILETHITTIAKVIVQSDGLIVTEPIPEMKDAIELEHAKETLELIKKVKGDNRLLMIYIRDGKITQEARSYFSQCEEIFDKVGIIATGPLQILVANFFLGINKPKMPVRLFKKKEKAVQWLKI